MSHLVPVSIYRQGHPLLLIFQEQHIIIIINLKPLGLFYPHQLLALFNIIYIFLKFYFKETTTMSPGVSRNR